MMKAFVLSISALFILSTMALASGTECTQNHCDAPGGTDLDAWNTNTPSADTSTSAPSPTPLTAPASKPAPVRAAAAPPTPVIPKTVAPADAEADQSFDDPALGGHSARGRAADAGSTDYVRGNATARDSYAPRERVGRTASRRPDALLGSDGPYVAAARERCFGISRSECDTDLAVCDHPYLGRRDCEWLRPDRDGYRPEIPIIDGALDAVRNETDYIESSIGGYGYRYGYNNFGFNGGFGSGRNGLQRRCTPPRGNWHNHQFDC